MKNRWVSTGSMMATALVFCAGAAWTNSAWASAVSVLYTFNANGIDATGPYAPLIAHDGILYGTAGGGSASLGAVFQLDPTTGKEAVLHSFASGGDGAFPSGGVTYYRGALYGCTQYSGSATHDAGLVYKIDLSTGQKSVVHAFSGTDGNYPIAELLVVGDALYGTTIAGGASNGGVVFKLDPASGQTTVVHSFTGADGLYPDGVSIASGLLIGATDNGGAFGKGVIFALDPADGKERVIYSFAGGADGEQPESGLAIVGDVAYGATLFGGSSRSGHGTVFAVNIATGVKTIFTRYPGRMNGKLPNGHPILVGNTLYVTTTLGGPGLGGTVMTIDTTNGTIKLIHAFSRRTNGTRPIEGARPLGGLLSYGGALYGTTSRGGGGIGRYQAGTAFKLIP